MTTRAVLASSAFALFGYFGCGGGAQETRLDAMRDEIDKAHEGSDGMGRGSAVSDPGEPPLVVPTAYAPGGEVRPPPAVVQIGPPTGGAVDDGAGSDDPQDTTPRPTIRVLGSVRGGGRNARRAADQIEQIEPDDGSASSSAQPPGSHVIDPEAKRAYDAALSLVNAKRFDQALDALTAFLVQWPDHPYANNAMYWRGECYFARGEYLRAAEQFEGLIRRFPAGSKVPDALLKLAMSHQRLGNSAKAKECLDRLAQQFPDSEAAHRIPPASSPAANPPGPAEDGRP